MNTGYVADETVGKAFGDIQNEFDVFVAGRLFVYANDIGESLSEREYLVFYFNATGFDFGKIENVVSPPTMSCNVFSDD